MQIGKVLDALDMTGKADNTLVMYVHTSAVSTRIYINTVHVLYMYTLS